MRQKLFFLMLTLFMLSAASVQAQVTIGADEPHPSAILDLQSDNLGFKLPVIELGDVSVFQLSGTATNADGIMIYNSSDETIGGSGKGIYVWNGSKWNFAGKSGQIVPADIPVKNIKITSAGYVTELKASGGGSTLQLTATVEPDDASQEVIWSKVYNPAVTAGDVTVDATGLVTGVKTGNVTVRATATDGSGAYRDLALTVKPSGVVTGIIVASVNGSSPIEIGKTLQLQATVEPTTAYPVVTWSVDNSGIATINASSGLVTAIAVGSTTVTATAADGSLVSSEPYPLEVIPGQPLNTTTVEIDGTEYQAYVYMGKTWTIQNMTHGVAQYAYYNGDNQKPGKYYTYAQAQLICSGAFRLPTQADYESLFGALNSPFALDNEIEPWKGVASLVGYFDGSWNNYGARTRYWGANGLFVVQNNNVAAWAEVSAVPGNAAQVVRCVSE